MLPYHWHHSWNGPDPRYNAPYAGNSHGMKYPDRPCCPRHGEEINRLYNKMEMMESQLKSVMNHLVKQGLDARIPNATSTPLVESPPTPQACSSSSAILRKRKSISDKDSSKCSTIVKRKKLIHDLEQQVAAERADNIKMEEKILEMRKQLAALKSRRQEMTRNRLEKVIDEKGSDAGEIDSEADSDDEYESDGDESGNTDEKVAEEHQEESVTK